MCFFVVFFLMEIGLFSVVVYILLYMPSCAISHFFLSFGLSIYVNIL